MKSNPKLSNSTPSFIVACKPRKEISAQILYVFTYLQYIRWLKKSSIALIDQKIFKFPLHHINLHQLIMQCMNIQYFYHFILNLKYTLK